MQLAIHMYALDYIVETCISIKEHEQNTSYVIKDLRHDLYYIDNKF